MNERPKMMKTMKTELFETLPGLARYEIYNYIEKEVCVLHKIKNVPLLFQQFENGYFDGYIDMEDIVDIYDRRFPEDEIYTIFSPHDIYQKYIYELGRPTKQYHEYSEEKKNTFMCLRDVDIKDCFQFRYDKDIEVELSELFGSKQMKPFWIGSRIFPKSMEETNTFLKQIVKMINEKIEKKLEYEKVFDLISDYECLNKKIEEELEKKDK